MVLHIGIIARVVTEINGQSITFITSCHVVSLVHDTHKKTPTTFPHATETCVRILCKCFEMMIVVVCVLSICNRAEKRSPYSRTHTHTYSCHRRKSQVAHRTQRDPDPTSRDAHARFRRHRRAFVSHTHGTHAPPQTNTLTHTHNPRTGLGAQSPQHVALPAHWTHSRRWQTEKRRPMFVGCIVCLVIICVG